MPASRRQHISDLGIPNLIGLSMGALRRQRVTDVMPWTTTPEELRGVEHTMDRLFTGYPMGSCFPAFVARD
jgi:hypothetical protein